MAKSTIENRVYLFESLASSYLSGASEALGSSDAKAQERAMRALADLAYVSCVVADTADESPEKVREQVMARVQPGAASRRGEGLRPKRKKR